MNKTIINLFGVGVGITILIGIAVILPLLYIWALNTLFGLTIAYTLETWSAVVLLQMFFQMTIKMKGKE